MLFKQSESDRNALGELLNLSERQMDYLSNAEAGCGLMRCGNVVVPFDGRFDKDTKLYQAMTTKIEEVDTFAG